jgi:hypothetical protein
MCATQLMLARVRSLASSMKALGSGWGPRSARWRRQVGRLERIESYLVRRTARGEG